MTKQDVNINPATMILKLKGEQSYKIPEIKKLFKFTGMTFEACFAKKETPGAATPRESR